MLPCRNVGNFCVHQIFQDSHLWKFQSDKMNFPGYFAICKTPEPPKKRPRFQTPRSMTKLQNVQYLQPNPIQSNTFQIEIS